MGSRAGRRVHVLDPGAPAGSRTALCGAAGLPPRALRLAPATCRACAGELEALVVLAVELAERGRRAPSGPGRSSSSPGATQLARAERLSAARRFAFTFDRYDEGAVEAWPAPAADPAGGGWRAARRSAS